VEFLDELKAYLERPTRARYVPDVAAHRKHLLQRIDELKKAGMEAPEIRRLYEETSPNLDKFLDAVSISLARQLGEEPDSGPSFASLINIALDRRLGVEATTGFFGLDLEIDAVAQITADSAQWQLIFHQEAMHAKHYAVEISAVTRGRAQPSITEIGKLILTLPARDVRRWLLAVEVIQSMGPDDRWRLCRSSARAILETPRWEHSLLDDSDDLGPAPWRTLNRLERMGLVSLQETDRKTEIFNLLAEGRPFLEEIAADEDTPFTLLARALLQDQTAATLAGLPGAAALMQSEGAATVATRHARMVAHEIRNALVPVQAALSGLYEEVERRGQGDALATRRDRIDGGIDRMFRFVREVAQTADLTARSVELFNVALAIEGAIAGIEAELGLSIPFTREAELHPVKGSIDRFVLALRNLLRNAAQSRAETPVQIHVTGGVNNGAEVFIRVDDDGPGVPTENRSKIFEPGFTGRPGGSGQGLAFVREVVESEMAGRVLCEESPLGGARFVVRLPVGTKRSA
jgi:signal transduction histidine kinase